jgi:predicted DNA-binding protein (MmcQ/YjbR family)
MGNTMSRTIRDCVRELCLCFPDTEEMVSHGSPAFKVCGKTFATFTINHHGDGRVALNINAPPGAQQLYTQMEPEYYFVPPYVGPKGWLGIDLNRSPDWDTVVNRVREAWEYTAPPGARNQLGETAPVNPPDEVMSPEQIDAFLRPRALEVMARLKGLNEKLPETSRTKQFGNPVWKAGKKTFVSSHCYRDRLCLQFWVGAEQQSMLCADERYSIPAYIGHNGWIELDVEDYADWDEIEYLLENSYRHFALKRMLKVWEEANLGS